MKADLIVDTSNTLLKKARSIGLFWCAVHDVLNLVYYIIFFLIVVFESSFLLYFDISKDEDSFIANSLNGDFKLPKYDETKLLITAKEFTLYF